MPQTHVSCTRDRSMKRNDAIPELIVIDERSRRETIELCNDEQDGLRCTLEKGHAGLHECVAYQGKTRWPASKAS